MFQAKFNTGIEEISIPSSWHEVTYSQYCELINNDGDWFRRISILSGLKEDDVKRFSTDLFTIMLSRASFLNNIDELLNSLFIPKEYENFNVGATDIGDFISAQQELERVDNELKSRIPEPTEQQLLNNRAYAGVKITRLFTQKRYDGYSVPGLNISNEPVTKVLGLVNFFLLKLENS